MKVKAVPVAQCVQAQHECYIVLQQAGVCGGWGEKGEIGLPGLEKAALPKMAALQVTYIIRKYNKNT